ncbi:MAG: DUF4417 domain-containing protein [Clostridia bacterium]|nr:DUF4417 domain-containing protein [Clostridia bacterium]
MLKRKANLNDGCNPELVAGAKFDGLLNIPVIEAPDEIIIPKGITPFSLRERAVGKEEAVAFFEKDPKFAEVLINPADYIEDFSRFKALVSIDCSLYRDAPLAVQVTNLYRNRALGSYYQRHGSYVIPLIRWGNEYTFTTKYFPEKIAFLGVPKHSIVCIGTYGCSNTKEDKYYLHAGLDAMMETLEPDVVLVYGSMNGKIFDNYLNYAEFVHFPDWTTRAHGGD